MAQLSRTADHALRAVLFLAQHEGKGPIPADRIAEALGAPANYLAKTLNGLAAAGVVEGLRGPAGGFRLLVPAGELPLARVIEAFDEPHARSACLLGDRPCTDDDPCGAHRCWVAIREHARAPLQENTVRDLLDGRCDVAL